MGRGRGCDMYVQYGVVFGSCLRLRSIELNTLTAYCWNRIDAIFWHGVDKVDC